MKLNQRQREIACKYKDGPLSQMYAVCMSGKVQERNIPYLIKEARKAAAEALENRRWHDYYELIRFYDELSAYDSFEFIGEG